MGGFDICDADGKTTLRVAFSDHAVRRYQLRAREGLEYDDALAALEAMGPLGRITHERPPWLRSETSGAACFLVLADLAFPLVVYSVEPLRLTAVTCIARGSLTPWERERRNRRRTRRTRWGSSPGHLLES